MKKTHRKLRQGGYLAATTAIVVAIVVFLNLIVGQLPTHLLEFDLSDKQLYTVTDTSKEFLAGLDKDVEIVVLAEESNVDERIAKFLDNYAALSSHNLLKLLTAQTQAEADAAAQAEEAEAETAEESSGETNSAAETTDSPAETDSGAE